MLKCHFFSASSKNLSVWPPADEINNKNVIHDFLKTFPPFCAYEVVNRGRSFHPAVK